MAILMPIFQAFAAGSMVPRRRAKLPLGHNVEGQSKCSYLGSSWGSGLISSGVCKRLRYLKKLKVSRGIACSGGLKILGRRFILDFGKKRFVFSGTRFSRGFIEGYLESKAKINGIIHRGKHGVMFRWSRLGTNGHSVRLHA